jgi:kynurenine formamidase
VSIRVDTDGLKAPLCLIWSSSRILLTSRYAFPWREPTASVAKLMGPVVVVNVSAACAGNPDCRISAADLTRWEKQHGRIPDGAIVLIRTGWGQYWPDKRRYLGADRRGDVARLHFPGLSREAAEFLVQQRRISGDGIDTASIDTGSRKIL